MVYLLPKCKEKKKIYEKILHYQCTIKEHDLTYRNTKDYLTKTTMRPFS